MTEVEPTQIEPRSDVQAEAPEARSEAQPEAQSEVQSKQIATAKQVKEQHPDTKEKKKRTGYLSLFRYASPLDRLILLFSTLCAIAAGTALPLITVPASSSSNHQNLHH